MPDNDNSNQNDDDPKTLRGKLEAALKENNGYKSQIADLQGQVLMPHLNKRQRRSVLRELAEDKLDVNEDNIKDVAKDLGYNMEPTAPPTNNDGNQNGDQNQGGDGGENSNANNGEGSGDGSGKPDVKLPPEVVVALEASGYMDIVQQYSDGPSHDLGFEEKMNSAKSPEELDAIIRAEGPRHGIMLETDTI